MKYGIISIFKFHQAKQKTRALSHKKNIVLKKTKYIKAPNLCRKKDLVGSFWRKNLHLVAKDAWPRCY